MLPNHRVPAVTQMVWYKVGAADDPRGNSGLAHFLEHLMFKGTKAHPPGAFGALIAQNGGRDNAFTSEDYTAFHETVAREQLELVMRLEADRMTGLVLDEPAVLSEREVVLEERRTRIDNDPTALLREQLYANLFLNNSSRVPTIGWEPEIRKLGTAEALAFYRDWYMPNNAVLIVAGDADPAEVRRLAESNFGGLPAGTPPPRLRLDEPEHRAPVRLEMKSARVAQPSWRRYYVAPSYRTGATQHAYALQVLAEILGGGVGSRLYQNLVLKDGIALVGQRRLLADGARDDHLRAVRDAETRQLGRPIWKRRSTASCAASSNTASSPTRCGAPRSACRRLPSMPATASPAWPISSAAHWRSVARSRMSPPGPTGSAR